MSEHNGGTFAGFEYATTTQRLDVGEQLQAGIRYFDIRPVVAGGGWVAGHYTKTPIGYQGANGQGLRDMIEQTNNFLDTHQELVVWSVSHTMDTDDGYRALDSAQWASLLEELGRLHHRWTVSDSAQDVTKIPIQEFVRSSPAILIRLNAPEDVDIGEYQGKGFFRFLEFPIYDSYSDTNDKATMIRDQIAKMKDKRKDKDDSMFLLSWILTQDAVDIFEGRSPVLRLGDHIYSRLFKDKSLWKHLSGKTWPNVISLDAVPKDGRLRSFVVAVNRYWVGDC